jgi:hypothetical protein
MKARTKSEVTLLAVVLLTILLVAIDLCRSYKSARRLAALDAERFEDCFYAGTKLSYSQINEPPEYLRLPHWEVTYNSANSTHQFTRAVRLSFSWEVVVAVSLLWLAVLIRVFRKEAVLSNDAK